MIKASIYERLSMFQALFSELFLGRAQIKEKKKYIYIYIYVYISSTIQVSTHLLFYRDVVSKPKSHR